MPYCGVAKFSWRSNGRMEGCRILLNPSTSQCNFLSVVTHEMGHALGFLSHSDDGGIMKAAALGPEMMITTQTREFFRLLYALPPGTDIRDKLPPGERRLVKDANLEPRFRYDPAGGDVYTMELEVREDGCCGLRC